MKVVGDSARTRREQVASFAERGPIRPALRLRLWTGEAGSARQCSATDGIVDLTEHVWVLRIEADFDRSPGKYRVDYAADPWGMFSAVGDLREADWISLAAGESSEEPRLAAGNQYTRSGSERAAWHDQEPLFMRWIRVTVDSDTGAEVTQVRVYADTAIDLTARVREDSVSLTRQTEGKRRGTFVKPVLSFDLADYDGQLALEGPPPSPPVNGGGLRYSDGFTRLHSNARYTLEVRQYGPEWEMPTGLDGTGWWPVFAGRQKSRNWNQRANADGTTETVLSITAESGRKLRGKFSEALLEQQTVDRFLGSVLTVDGEKRLIGIGSPRPGLTRTGGLGTAENEFVATTRIFGSNWWSEVVTIDAGKERVWAVGSDAEFLYLVVSEPATAENQNNPEWWLVKYDLLGAEIERISLGVTWGTGGVGGGRSREGASRGFNNRWSTVAVMGNWLWIGGATANKPNPTSPDELTVWEPMGRRFYRDDLTRDWDDLKGGIVFPCSGGILEGKAGQIDWRNQGGCGYLSFYGLNSDGQKEEVVKDIAIDLRDVPQAAVLIYHGLEEGIWRYTLLVLGELLEYRGHVVGQPDDSPHLWSPVADPAQAQSIRQFEVMIQESGDNYEVSLQYSRTWTGEGLRSGMTRMGDSIVAAGFGPDDVQGIARVAQLGWYLENSRIRSEGAGDSPVMNFAEPELRVGGEIWRKDLEFSVERETGRLSLLRLPEDGLPVRIGYDYEPVLGMVPIENAERWGLAEEVAAGFGLTLRVDEFERLCWEMRTYSERVAAAEGKVWRLGQTFEDSGLAWIVEESIEILSARTLEAVDASLYSLTSASGGKWKLTVGAIEAAETWLVRFAVQQDVPYLGAVRGLSESCDADRVITEAVMTGIRRVPSDTAQRIEQVFDVAPGDLTLASSFERVREAGGTSLLDWKPTERIYEESAEEEQPKFHVKFDQPLICGSSLWGVKYGKQPVLYGGAAITGTTARYVKVTLATAAEQVNYHVWIEKPGSFRVATAEDFEDMHGNCKDGIEPETADDVTTVNHFFVKRMNELGGASTIALAYHSEWKYWRRDSAGRIVEDSDRAGTPGSAEEWLSVGWPEKAVVVRLRPEDSNGQPLFFDRVQVGDVEIGDARMQVEDVQVTSGGLRLAVRNRGAILQRLVVEVTGYPALEAERFSGSAAARAELRERFGNEPRKETYRFLPNLEYARRAAEECVLLRGREADQWKVECPWRPTLLEDQLVWVTMPSGTRRLMRTTRVTHRWGSDGSVTEAGVE